MQKEYIGIRCSKDEKKVLKKLAHQYEMTLSQYLRFKGLTNQLKNK